VCPTRPSTDLNGSIAQQASRSLLNDAVAQIGGQARQSHERGSGTPLRGNGGAEDKANGDDLVIEMSDMHRSTGF